jgi:hypothetical protein
VNTIVLPQLLALSKKLDEELFKKQHKAGVQFLDGSGEEESGGSSPKPTLKS